MGIFQASEYVPSLFKGCAFILALALCSKYHTAAFGAVFVFKFVAFQMSSPGTCIFFSQGLCKVILALTFWFPCACFLKYNAAAFAHAFAISSDTVVGVPGFSGFLGPLVCVIIS